MICWKRKILVLWLLLRLIRWRWQLIWFDRCQIYSLWRCLVLWLGLCNFRLVILWRGLDLRKDALLVHWSKVFLCGIRKIDRLPACLISSVWSWRWWDLTILLRLLFFQIVGRRLGLLKVMLWIKGGLLSSLRFEFAASVLICEVYNFELSWVDVEDGSDEDVFKFDACVFAAFEEDAFIFDVVLNEGGVTISIVLSLMK